MNRSAPGSLSFLMTGQWSEMRVVKCPCGVEFKTPSKNALRCPKCRQTDRRKKSKKWHKEHGEGKCL